MNEKDIFLKLYDVSSYAIDNCTKPQKVTVYTAIPDQQENRPLFEFEYKPILEQNEYLILCQQFDGLPILVSLYNHLSCFYASLYMQCITWYKENVMVKEAFNFAEQIKKYELRIADPFSCEIIHLLDPSCLDNINFYNNLKVVIRLALEENISSLNILFFGKQEPILKCPYEPRFKLLENSVRNIVYYRFLEFLKQQAPLDNKDEVKLSSITNNFDYINVNEVFDHFKILVEKKHLSEEDLINYLNFAFDKKQTPKRLFKLNNIQSTKKIIAIFYEYYKKVAAKPHGRQKEYSALLGDYFDGFNTPNVSTNFSK